MLGFGFGNRAKGAPAIFDPATQSWDGWFRGNYTGSPWNGTASLGTSGSRSVSEATNPATAGTAVNGKTPASFNGTNKKLTDAGNISQYVTPSEGVLAALVFTPSITGGTAAGYDNPTICCDLAGGNLGLHLGSATNDKFVAYLYDAVNGAMKAELPISLSTWTFVQFRWKASTPVAEARINGGIWTSLSGPAFTGINGTLASLFAMGRNYSQALWMNGDVLEFFASKTLKSDLELDNVRSYLNATYPSISV